jgi:hypothetical protein
VIERHARVCDRPAPDQHGETSHHTAGRADLAAVMLCGRGAEPRPEQLVRTVEQMDLHRAEA